MITKIEEINGKLIATLEGEMDTDTRRGLPSTLTIVSKPHINK